MCNFVRGCYEEQFREIILNLDQWFKRRGLLKIILIWSYGGLFVWLSGTIYATLKEGIIENIHVKLYESWTSGLGGVVV